MTLNWNIFRKKHILIAGVGGLGSIVAEICSRIGVGEISIFDFDNVNHENLNRMIFKEKHIGKTKVEVIKNYLNEINSNVVVNEFHGDIMGFELEDKFQKQMKSCDIAFLCLDNVPARQYFNSIAIQESTTYIDAGMLRSGMGGYVHLCIPKKTACYQCNAVKTNDIELNIAKLPCTASIPTVINIVASLQAHHMIKYFLQFGTVPDFIQYNAFTDEFLKSELKRDPECHVCGD